MTMKDYLSPITFKEFCLNYWGEKIFCNKVQNSNIQNLLTWNEVQQWLKNPSFYSKVEVFLRTDSFTDFIQPTSYDEIMRGIEDGMTLQIRYLQRFIDSEMKLAKLLADFQSQVIHPISSLTLFYCLPTAMPTAIHKDISEIFSLQIAGKKKWWINMDKCLTEQMCFKEGEITQWDEFTLTGGNMMYLPSYLPHKVKCVDEPSLSVAMVFSNIQFAGLLEFLQEKIELKHWLKKPLPLWSDPEASEIIQEHTTEFLEQIVTQCRSIKQGEFYTSLLSQLQKL